MYLLEWSPHLTHSTGFREIKVEETWKRHGSRYHQCTKIGKWLQVRGNNQFWSIQGQFAICCKNFINAPIFSSFLQEWSVQIICSPFLLQAGFAAQKPHPIIAKSLFSHYSFLSGGFVSSEQQSLCPKAWLGINNLTTCHRQQWTMLLGLKYS